MATAEQEQLRKELSAEREELAGAVQTLRSTVRSRATAVGVGLAVASGIGAALRLLRRR
jgi:hypothetical protein